MIKKWIMTGIFLWLMILLVGCAAQSSGVENQSAPVAGTTKVAPTLDLNWFDMELKDVRTGEILHHE